jgi:tetratricopeptide (TPR) repeat protein
MIKTFVIVLMIILSTFNSSAKNKKNKSEEIDHVALAALLLRDSHYDRAEQILASVNFDEMDKKTKEEFDFPRFYTLKGLVFLKKELFTEAGRNFELAIEHGQTEPVVYLYLAQSWYGRNEWRKTIESIDKSGEAGKTEPAVFSMKAQCFWKLEEKENAWNTIKEGRKRFPQFHDFLRQATFYLIELELYQEAIAAGREYLSKSEGRLSDYIAIGSALRRGLQIEDALVFLESARLKYPDEERVLVELANTYIRKGDLFTAADLFERASFTKPEFLHQAAELYRMTGNHYRALSLNARVDDQKVKLKQRLSILIDMEQYDLALAMRPALSRHDMLSDEDIRYAIAYCAYMTGNFEVAETDLRKLTRPDLFRRAAEIRRMMEKCKTDGWECF